MSGVQFVHRYLAIAIFLIVAYMYIKSRQSEMLNIQTIAINSLSIIVLLQFVLGIFTLTYGVPIWLGVIHQLGAFILLANTVFCLFIFKKTT